jgi:hypothetical protein
MKRYTWLLLLTAPLAGQGCLGMEKMAWNKEPAADVKKTEKPEPAPAQLPAAPHLLSANDVTDANALHKAEELDAELTRAEREAQPQR